MATKKSNKLNASIIKQAHDKAFTQRKVSVIIENKTYDILLDEKFEVEKIKNVIMDLTRMYQQLYDANQIFDIPIYSTFLLLKYFTDLDFTDINSFEDAVKIIKYLDDFGCLDTIVNSFDQKEASKIKLYMQKAEENIKAIENNPELKHEYIDLMKFVEKIVEDKSKTDEDKVNSESAGEV
jgi:hypothetical protein